MVKNPPCNAADAGSIPSGGLGFLHAMEQRNPSSATAEAHAPQLERLSAAT